MQTAQPCAIDQSIATWHAWEMCLVLFSRWSSLGPISPTTKIQNVGQHCPIDGFHQEATWHAIRHGHTKLSLILEILKFLNCSWATSPKLWLESQNWHLDLYPFLGFCGDVTSHENQEYFSLWLQWCFTFLEIYPPPAPLFSPFVFKSGLVELRLRSFNLLCSHILTPVDLLSCIFSPS